jgi:uncharacterized protein
MAARAASLIIGVVFGVVLSWTGLSSPEVLREGLLFESAYLYLFFGSAVATAFVGTWLLRRTKPRAVLTGEPVTLPVARPERRHVAGAALFGLGWGIADVCPGPIATQLGQGVPWALATTAGFVAGVVFYLRRERAPERARSATLRPAVEEG